MGLFKKRSGPDFIIMGAQKAGTTALHQMLQAHPQVRSAQQKEIHYFDNDVWYGQGDIRAYHAQFPALQKISSRIQTFEASPLYLYHPHVAERLYQYNPELKLIAILREPASRAFSAWTMYHHHFKTGRNTALRDTRSFDQAIADDLASLNTSDYTTDIRAYVKRGLYAQQIDRYYQFFPRKQILVLDSQDILHQWPTYSKVVTHFLGLPQADMPLQKVLQSRVDQIQEYADTIATLRAYYKPHNDQLNNLLDRKFSWT